jgi:hypothetical protein
MKKRFIILATIYMLFPAMLLAQPTGKRQLVGIWEVKVLPVGQSQSPLLSLAMFGGDGSFTTGVRYKALPAISALQDIGPSSARVGALGRHGRQGVPPDVLRGDAEGRQRSRLPASSIHLGFV